MRPAILVLLLGACGRGGFEALVLPDAPSDADATDAATDAGTDAAQIGSCGTTLLLDDPFSDATAAPGFSSKPDTGLTLVEGGGRLEIPFAASVPGGSYAYYRSSTAFTAEGLCVAVEVSQLPGGAASGYVKLRTAQLEVEIITFNGELHLRTHQNNTIVIRQMIPLDLVESRFWRIRHVAGTTYWETSPDGLGYTTHAQLAGFFTVTTCQLEIGAGAQTTVTNAGLARFEGAVVRGP